MPFVGGGNDGLLMTGPGGNVQINLTAIDHSGSMEGQVTWGPYREEPMIRTGVKHTHVVSVAGMLLTDDAVTAKTFAQRFEANVDAQDTGTITLTTRDSNYSDVKILEWNINEVDLPGTETFYDISFTAYEV